MTYTLYYAEFSAAMGVRVMLEELHQPYELIETDISMDVPRAPEVLALNPNGWIPVLVWEQGAIYECAAIAVFLCDRHREYKLIPDVHSPHRGLFLQWLVYFSSSLQNAYQMTYYPDRFCEESAVEANVQMRSRRRLRELWKVVDDAIGEHDWLVGNTFSAADIYMFMLVTWLREEHGHPNIHEFENIARVVRQVVDRPSVRKVYARHLADTSY